MLKLRLFLPPLLVIFVFLFLDPIANYLGACEHIAPWNVLSSAQTGCTECKRPNGKKNAFADVESVTLSDNDIKLSCRPGHRPGSDQACNDSMSIQVVTKASDKENDPLIYNYTVSGGRIVGTGATVTWDLSGLSPGTYTITVGVDDGCGLCGKIRTETVTVSECNCKATNP